MITSTRALRTAAAPLLYWLLIVCGLAGISLLRIDTPRDLLPLWLGSVGGTAFGQLLAWARVRAWLLVVALMFSLWSIGAFLAIALSSLGGLDTLLMGFLPAAICGYLSLSERGGLAAFWYPAVLWMVVILDRPGAGVAGVQGALPFVVGLAALFVAFLHARETRRIAIWQTHAHVRLAPLQERAVLRTSPLRAASQLVWTGLVGVATLVLAAWIAPHLWQRERGGQPAAGSTSSGVAGEGPCCPEYVTDEPDERERVREYFPLLHGHDTTAPSASRPCTPCRGSTGAATAAAAGGTAGAATGDAPPSSFSSDVSSTAKTTSPAPLSTAVTHAATPSPPPAITPPLPSATATSVTNLTAMPTPTPTSVPTHAPITPGTVVMAIVPASGAPIEDAGSPWKSALALCIGALAAHALVRAVRRQLTVRHLSRPFWPETLSQRFSNQWQLMLIGLRDAGVHAVPGEQPQAFARRVGLPGMDTCATLLERVRHGVRVDASDLDAMEHAVSAVYRAARQQAGALGRAASFIRWPLV